MYTTTAILLVVVTCRSPLAASQHVWHLTSTLPYLITMASPANVQVISQLTQEDVAVTGSEAIPHFLHQTFFTEFGIPRTTKLNRTVPGGDSPTYLATLLGPFTWTSRTAATECAFSAQQSSSIRFLQQTMVNQPRLTAQFIMIGRHC